MQSPPVVEPLDPVEDGLACRSARRPRLAVDQFRLEGRHETLGQRVVVTVSGTAHRRGHAVLGEQCLIGARRILAAAIRVMDQRSRWPAPDERHGQRITGQFPAQMLRHRPPHDPTRAGIKDHRQIQPAFPGRDVGDVADPQLIELLDSELACTRLGAAGGLVQPASCASGAAIGNRPALRDT